MTTSPTPDTPDQVRDIARDLSKAQRTWLLTFTNEPRWSLPVGMSKRTRQALISYGLVQELRPINGVGFMRWYLTAFGEQVIHLLSQPQPEQKP